MTKKTQYIKYSNEKYNPKLHFDYTLPKTAVKKEVEIKNEHKFNDINYKWNKYTNNNKLDKNLGLLFNFEAAYFCKVSFGTKIDINKLDVRPVIYGLADFLETIKAVFGDYIKGLIFAVESNAKQNGYVLYLKKPKFNLLEQYIQLLDYHLGKLEGLKTGISGGNSKDKSIWVDRIENNGFAGAAEFILYQHLYRTPTATSPFFKSMANKTRREIFSIILTRYFQNQFKHNKLAGKVLGTAPKKLIIINKLVEMGTRAINGADPSLKLLNPHVDLLPDEPETDILPDPETEIIKEDEDIFEETEQIKPTNIDYEVENYSDDFTASDDDIWGEIEDLY